jgi:hypothetical protein
MVPQRAGTRGRESVVHRCESGSERPTSTWRFLREINGQLLSELGRAEDVLAPLSRPIVHLGIRVALLALLSPGIAAAGVANPQQRPITVRPAKVSNDNPVVGVGVVSDRRAVLLDEIFHAMAVD